MVHHKIKNYKKPGYKNHELFIVISYGRVNLLYIFWHMELLMFITLDLLINSHHLNIFRIYGKVTDVYKHTV